jgi:hypothetical protein
LACFDDIDRRTEKHRITGPVNFKHAISVMILLTSLFLSCSNRLYNEPIQEVPHYDKWVAIQRYGNDSMTFMWEFRPDTAIFGPAFFDTVEHSYKGYNSVVYTYQEYGNFRIVKLANVDPSDLLFNASKVYQCFYMHFLGDTLKYANAYCLDGTNNTISGCWNKNDSFSTAYKDSIDFEDSSYCEYSGNDSSIIVPGRPNSGKETTCGKYSIRGDTITLFNDTSSASQYFQIADHKLLLSESLSYQPVSYIKNGGK